MLIERNECKDRIVSDNQAIAGLKISMSMVGMLEKRVLPSDNLVPEDKMSSCATRPRRRRPRRAWSGVKKREAGARQPRSKVHTAQGDAKQFNIKDNWGCGKRNKGHWAW